MRASVPTEIARINMILHVGLMAAVPMYGVLGFVLSQQGWQGYAGPPEVLRMMTIILAGISFFELSIAVVLPRILLSEQRLRNVMLAAENEPLLVALGQARVAFIIRLAILESIAVFGLVLAMIGQDLTLFYPFGAVSLVAMALARFNPDPVLEAYEQLAIERDWPAQP